MTKTADKINCFYHVKKKNGHFFLGAVKISNLSSFILVAIPNTVLILSNRVIRVRVTVVNSNCLRISVEKVARYATHKRTLPINEK